MVGKAVDMTEPSRALSKAETARPLKMTHILQPAWKAGSAPGWVGEETLLWAS